MKKTLSIQLEEPTICLIPGIVYSQVMNYYGKVPRSLQLHLLRPDAWDSAVEEKLPTVIWVIGGAWQETAPLRYAAELSFLAKAGYNVAMIDYRVNSEARYPAQIQDVKTAIRFLRAHADKYGVDENRIAIMGDSAGGYLSAMVGVTAGVGLFETKEWAGYDSSVKAVIDWYGPIDMKTMQEDFERENNMQMGPIMKFLGEAETRNEEILKQASALSYVSENTPPFLILHGTADEMVAVGQSIRFYEELQKKNVPSDLYLLEGVYHARFEFWQQEIKDIILDFLKRYL